MTLRDVRVLRDHLTADEDWRSAADAYAIDHDRYAADLRRIQGWYRDLWYGVGPEAEAVRARALPLLLADPTRYADMVGLGPDASCDEAARRRLFGED